MNFCEIVARARVSVGAPYGLRATGIYILKVAHRWEGPIRLVFHRADVAPVTVWGAAATVGSFHRVEMTLYADQGWSVSGGTLVISGDVFLGPCLTVHPVVLRHHHQAELPDEAADDTSDWGS